MSCCRPIEEEGTEAQRGATTCPETRGQSAPRPEPFFSAETTCFSAASPVPFLCWALPLRSSPGLRPGPFLLPPSTFPGQSPVFRNHPRGTAATLSPAGAPLLSARRFPQLLPTGQRHGSRKHGAPPFPQSLFSLADSLGRIARLSPHCPSQEPQRRPLRDSFIPLNVAPFKTGLLRLFPATDILHLAVTTSLQFPE